MRKILSVLIAALIAIVVPSVARADDTRALRIGIVTYLSGPGAGPMGIPARNAAELAIESLNAGALPTPYRTKGFGGRALEMVLLDEAGSTSSVVSARSR